MTTTVLNAKICEIENTVSDQTKYVTTQEFNKLTAKHFAARLKQDNLVNKAGFGNKVISFNRKHTSNKTKYLENKKQTNNKNK